MYRVVFYLSVHPPFLPSTVLLRFAHTVTYTSLLLSASNEVVRSGKGVTYPRSPS